mmetsp:Transcript_2549/g.4638  ORF Transcript_2549/g.4638 Transcript_2549/m.4638 type:complete len:88 (+) Transcript_2549:623-886(+)
MVRLYNKHLVKPSSKSLKKLLNKLLHSKRLPSVAKSHDYEIDGVCLSAFNKSHYSCGQPSPQQTVICSSLSFNSINKFSICDIFSML